jgi:peptidoglycan/LPS O-acetylase OafA/YrhL
LFSGLSLNDKLVAEEGKPSGFDYMRLVLALSVICFHSILLSYGQQAQDDLWRSAWRPFIAVILPMFFGLSGFLVAGSLDRSKTLVTFLGLRVLRIIPALAFEVTLSALVLGPLVTVEPLKAYFTDRDFFAYFLNILGDIHYELPGLFLLNPTPKTVNGQLWTVPYEMYSYAVLTFLAVTGIFKRLSWLLFFMGGCYVLQILNAVFRPIEAVSTVHGPTLVMFFIAGLVLYQYRDKIKWNRALFCLSALLFLALLSVPNGDRFAALPGAYVTVYLGLLNPRRQNILLSGDYSYGLFLYGYPLQQAFMSIGPELHHWYWNLLVTIPSAGLIAVLSWWRVEKPALGLRKYLKDLEQWRINKQPVKVPDYA